MESSQVGSESSAGRVRRPFVSPRLTRYGKVERITMASGGVTGNFALKVDGGGGYF